MKFITKDAEPKEFKDWKDLGNDDWQPTYDELRGNEKAAVKKSLMEEQGYICCYCERRLEDRDSHIEHLRPQSDPTVDPLDYSNMLCSCQNQLKTGDLCHCGILKKDWFGGDFVSPLSENCEDNFSYTHDGRIQALPEDNNAAQQTITNLGLDIPKLNAQRRKAIEPFLDPDVDLDIDELSQFISGYLQKDKHDKFSPFWTTINSLFGDFALV